MRRLKLFSAFLILFGFNTSFCFADSMPAANSSAVVTPQTCSPSTGTLGALNASVQLNCPGVSTYEVVIVPNQTTPLTGTLQFGDSVTGVNRALFKAGVGELDVSSVSLSAQTSTMSYRLVSAVGAQVTVSAYTSGSVVATIYPTNGQVGTFLNNPVHTAQEGALRNGRAYTATTGIQSVTTGNYLSLQFTIPSSSNYRAFITGRVFACNQAGGTVPNEFYGVSNPTTNLATTAGTITNRRTGGVASTATINYALTTTHPDTNPGANLPAGGFVATGSSATTTE